MLTKNQILAAIGVIVVCITLVVSALIFTNSNIYIKNIGNAALDNGKVVNTISVTGDGKVEAKPDMAILTVSVSEIANTSEEALKNANMKLSQVSDVLNNNAIDPNDVQTSQFSIYPEYDYSSGTSVLKGQRATISVTIKVKKLDSTASKATKIIDEVAKVPNIQLGSIYFDIEDQTAYFTSARELAFNKAKQKATELAKLAGVKLLNPVSISDSTYDITPPVYKNTAFDLAPLTADSSGSSQISTGQLDLSVNLNINFGIE